jgi:RHS repeat-associated protein
MTTKTTFTQHLINSYRSRHYSALPSFSARGNVHRHALTFILFACCLFLFPLVLSAQNTKHTEYKADLTSRSNARVNPSTLAMEFSIPLTNYTGRAGNSLPVTFDYSSKVWRIAHVSNWQGRLHPVTDTRPEYAEKSAAGWTTSLDVPRIDTKIEMYVDDYENGEGRPWEPTAEIEPQTDAPVYEVFYIKRVRVEMPNGSSIEFRKDDAKHPYGTTQYPGAPGAPDLLGTFLAVDGSRMRLEMGTEIGVLYMPDGSHYEIPLQCYPTCTRNTIYTDRHGNRMTYNPGNKQWTDTLGRILVNPLPIELYNPYQTAGVRTLSYPGFNGSLLQFEFTWSQLSTQQSALKYASNISCRGQIVTSHDPSLFKTDSFTRVCGDTTPFNPVVLTQIKLPNGTFYRFSYNVYGEIEKIEYPTGGYERFEYGEIPPVASTGDATYDQSNRGVIRRWVSVNGNGTPVGEVEWRYEVRREMRTWLGEPGLYHVITYAPDYSWTEQLIHDEWRDEAYPYGFGEGRIGRAYETRTYKEYREGYPDKDKLLHRTLTEWMNTGPVTINGVTGQSGATRDLRPSRSVEISFEDGNTEALAKLSTIDYDTAGSNDLEQFAALNPKQSKTYKYRALDLSTAQTATLLAIAGTFTASDVASISETDYLYDANYKARGIVGLARERRVIEPAISAVATRMQMAYDEPGYGLLPCGATAGWTDPGSDYRSNTTTTRNWVSTSNTWIETHAQYDRCGNLRKSWDAKGNPSEVDYSADYQFAYPTHTSSPIPDPSGERGSNTPLETWTAYDFTTGKVTESKDANSFSTRFQYNDSLNRLTKVELPDGGQNEYWYGRNQFGEYTGSRTLINETGQKTESYQFFDGLGRSVRTFQMAKPDATEWITSDTQYDNMGRVWRVSNPYNTGGSGTPITTAGWTTTEYDALGRVRAITAPDGSKAETAYSNKTAAAPIGTQVTISHLAGQTLRSRTAVTDALGRLMQVVENPGELNYLTEYEYDVLGNLRKVSQGGQRRFFAYDSLSRLVRVKNPEEDVNGNLPAFRDAVTSNEQWSQAYSYDSNGNVATRTDARGVSANYVYDSMNRVRDISYTDGVTPSVGFVYDRVFNGKGRFGWNWTYLNATSPNSHTAVDSYDAMGRVTLQRQHFWVNGAWGPAYTVSRTYNLMGSVTSQKYPSGHIVNYDQFDYVGRLKNFTGNLGDGVQRTYATNIAYDEASRMTREQFGTQTPLYHKNRYNVRGQMWDVRLSTINDVENWNRGAIQTWYTAQNQANGASGTDNNGNVLMARTYIPTDDQISSHSFIESRYNYDQLNRVKYVEEYFNGQGTPSRQQYDYDRFGNRTINAAGSYGIGIPEPQFELGPGESLTNRIYAQGDMNIADPEARRMRYDKAGNLKYDSYTGQGERTYDAENRMTVAADASGQRSAYTYDANGKRVRRSTPTGNVWQVYGIEGELLAEYAAGVAPMQPQKEYGYRNGELLITAEGVGGSPPQGTTSATFLKLDTTTQGNWKGKYGSEGYAVVNDSTNYPAYAQVSLTGHNVYTWAASTTDVRALQKATVGSTDRIAATVYSSTEFTFDLNLTDGQAHQVAFYCLDWDYNDVRAQKVEIIDAASGAVLDSRNMSAYRNGQYAVWNLRGYVKIKFTYTGPAGLNAVASGVFFDKSSGQSSLSVGNSGFETPSLPGGYQYTPADTSWTFVGGGGVTGNSSGFTAGNPPAPEGTQVAFLQVAAPSSISQVVSGFQANTNYKVSFKVAQRGNYQSSSQDFEVFVDKTSLGVFRPTGTSYSEVSTMSFMTTAGAHTIKFVGKNTNGGDNTVFIDDVRVTGSVDAASTCTSTKTCSGKTGASTTVISWLVTDHLGTPRMIADQTGSLAGITRHDYLPFGEELYSGTGGRTGNQGYVGDNIRQQFTEYERDRETGLDYAQARYYSSAIGRFTSVDPLLASGNPVNPKTWNRYAYALNNPLRFTDPSGLLAGDFYDRQGYYLGSDGKNDNKVYLLNEGETAPPPAHRDTPGIPPPLAPVADAIRIELLKAASTEVGGLIILDRTAEGDNYTTGNFRTVGGENNVSGDTVEPGGPSTSESGKDKRIPEGVYDIKEHSGTKFKDTFVISNAEVPASRAILFHSGNSGDNTTGCIIPGLGNRNGTLTGGTSKPKMEELKTFIKSEGASNVKLIINNKIQR